MRVLLIAMLCAGCIGPANLALLPRSQNSTRDPDLTRPLVENPPMPREERRRPAEPQPASVTVGKAVSGAAALAWLLGAGAPLIGVYGTFEENKLGPTTADDP